MIPLILPSFGDIEPEIPLFLQTIQHIDLRKDDIDADPFGSVLHAIDSREAVGHYRPTVLIVGKQDDTTSREARDRVTSYCHDVLHRVRYIDPTDPLLEQHLATGLKHADVLVTLLSSDSFDPLPGDVFHDGVAAGARRLAASAGAEVIQWRAEDLQLPPEPQFAAQFQSTEIETCLSFKLSQHVTQTAEARFEERRHDDVNGDDPAPNRKRTVLGFPRNGKPFARQIAGELKDRQIRCDSIGEWERVTRRLKKNATTYDALIVILNGDDDWLDECTEWLDDIDANSAGDLPPIGAYCHKSEDDLDADPVPFDIDQFKEYFGKKDLPKLAQRIASNGGDA